MCVEAQNKKREQGEEVTMGEANKTDMDVEKVVVKDRGKSMAAPNNLVEQTLATMEHTVIKVKEHGKTEAEPVSNMLESEKLLKSVRLQQQIQRIKEVQMSRLDWVLVGLVCWWCGLIEQKVVGQLVFLAVKQCKIQAHVCTY